MSKKHMLLMMAGCGIMFLAVGAIYLFHIPSNRLIIGGIALLCPLSHVLMMAFMGHGHSDKAEVTHHHDQPVLKDKVSQG